MPHINHRRGDTRRRERNHYESRWWQHVGGAGHWNRIANRRLRSAVSQALMQLRACGYDIDIVDNFAFPVAREADNIWNYD